MTIADLPAIHAAPSTSIIAHNLGFLPIVTLFTSSEGMACVEVSLSGLYGAGKTMKLHADDWARISAEVSPWWQITKSGASFYVSCGSREALRIAQATSKVRALFLGRFLMNPPAGMFVRYRDGDHTNLVRGNLAVVTRSAHSQANGAAMRERTLRRHAETCAAKRAADEALRSGNA